MSLLGLANLRHLRRQPLQIILSVTGIALGVAVVLAVELANHSALRAFELSEQAVSGAATHRIRSAGAGIDEDFYRRLRVEYGFRQAAPRIIGSVRDGDGLGLQVLGIDPLASLGMGAPGAGPRLDAGTLIGTPGAVLTTAATARHLGVTPGQHFTVFAAGRPYRLRLTGLVQGDAMLSAGLRQTLVMDIATAQRLLQRRGRLDRIDLKLDTAARRRLAALLPPSLLLQSSAARGDALAQMTRAFRLNLTALSLLAVLIGGFLIYNTQTLFVLARRETLAVWRTLGVTRARLLAQVLTEAAWLASAGCLIGVGAGIALSALLLELVTRSINDLYFSLQVASLHVAPGAVLRACLLGMTAALVASAMPALEAARVAPRLALARSQVEQAARRLRGIGLLAGLALGGAAAAILVLSGRSVSAGFAALFCAVVGFACLAPTGLKLLTRGAAPLLARAFGWMGLWSARNVLATMSRTQVAVTALAVALAASVGVAVMIQSFRLSVEQWLDSYLRADVYISWPGDSQAAIDPALVARLRAQPAVAAVSTGRWRQLPGQSEPTTLFVLDTHGDAFERFQFLGRRAAAVWPAFKRGAVIVSESYAWARRLAPGDTLALPTARGSRTFSVAGVFRDYGSDRGRVVMYRATYDRYWDAAGFSSLSVYLHDGADSAAFLTHIEQGALRGSGLRARSDQRIRALSLAVFDRTFTVTEVLRLLTVIVAGIGVLGALVAIQLDRTREFAVLRACGLTRRELSGMMLLEGGIIGSVGAVLALPLGLLLAALLVFIINKRSFGWSMQFSVPWEQPLLTLAIGLAAGVVAALYPAWRMNRLPLLRSLRHE